MQRTVTRSGLTVNGPAIRALRSALGYTLAEFATEVDVSESFLSRVERGSRQPSTVVRKRIVAALGVPTGAIIREAIVEQLTVEAA